MAETAVATDAGARGVSAARSSRLMLVLLAASFALACFDRMLMVVVGETVKADFGLSDKQLSVLTGGAFVFIYGVCGVVCGWLADRINRLRLTAAALAVWSLLTMACGWATSFWQMAWARAGVGIGEAPNAPTSFSLIADLYPPERRPGATAVFMIGGMLGMLASFVAGSWIATHFGWRTAFLVSGPPGLALALLLYLLGFEPPRQGAQGAAAAGAIRLVLDNRPVLFLLLSQSVASFGNIGLMSWLPMFFIRSHHMSLGEIGLLFGPAMAIGSSVGMVVGGWAGNWAARRSVSRMLVFCAAVLAIETPTFAGLLLAPSQSVALALTFFAAALTGVFIPVSVAAWQTAADPRARGVTGGLSSLTAQIVGGAVLPFVVGVLSDRWAGPFGAEALRFALLASTAFLAVAVGLYVIAARLVARRLV